MDHVSDKSHKFLYRLMKEASLPDWVMEHEVPENLDECENTCFADTVDREYPIHTKADTYLSAAYAKEASLRPDVEDRLNKAVKLWNLQDEINKLEQGEA